MTADVASGSFRDPAGRVFERDGEIYRRVSRSAESQFVTLTRSGFYRKAEAAGFYIGHEEVAEKGEADVAVVHHPRVPFVSYPYEWCFAQLKAAALYHLDVQIFALDHDVSLSDATAYNVQFIGPKPIFIDMLSFRPLRAGEYWTGQRQFVEQFLGPMLLDHYLGVPHNEWFRGSLDGIPIGQLARILPLKARLDWHVWLHVFVPARLQLRESGARSDAARIEQFRPLPLQAYRSMLTGLRHWLATVTPKSCRKTTWRNYSTENTYVPAERDLKSKLVEDFCKDVSPATLLDFGCNTGDYDVAAMRAGAKSVIGFDVDGGALQLAFERAVSNSLNFLPLFLDAANPSPDQGWRQSERLGTTARAKGDALIALAFIHHLAIGRNIPLREIVSWLCACAPVGLIEFVPKTDETVLRMLRFRDDIFADYSEEAFVSALQSNAKITRKDSVTGSGRVLYRYHVTNPAIGRKSAFPRRQASAARPMGGTPTSSESPTSGTGLDLPKLHGH
jgi:ribosomal protein L11 methylase PrmA